MKSVLALLLLFSQLSGQEACEECSEQAIDPLWYLKEVYRWAYLFCHHLMPQVPYIKPGMEAVLRFLADKDPDFDGTRCREELVGERLYMGHRTIQINGASCTPQDAREAAEVCSVMSGGEQIRIAYHATEGVVPDFLECVVHWVGVVTQATQQALATVKQSLKEVATECAGGYVTLVAHSQGGIILEQVLLQLSCEERALMEVYTFGSPTLFRDCGLRGLVHFVASADPLCMPYWMNPSREHPNVFEIASPSRDVSNHYLLGPSYRSYFEKIGQDTLTKFHPVHTLELSDPSQ